MVLLLVLVLLAPSTGAPTGAPTGTCTHTGDPCSFWYIYCLAVFLLVLGAQCSLLLHNIVLLHPRLQVQGHPHGDCIDIVTGKEQRRGAYTMK